MDFEKVLQFGAQYLSNYFAVFFATLGRPALRFKPILSPSGNRPAIALPSSAKIPETGTQLNPKLLGFVVISIFIGSTSSSLIPRKNIGQDLVTTVIIGTVVILRLFKVMRSMVDCVARLGAKLIACLKDVRLSVWISSFAVSLATRLISFAGVVFLFESVQLPLALSSIFLITSLYVVLPYLPFNTPGGFGVTEGYLTALLLYSGIELNVAVATSVQVHLLQLAIAGILGLLGMTQLQYMSFGRNTPSRLRRARCPAIFS